MFPAIFAKTYPGTTADVLAAAAADGYRGVQFNLQCAGIASIPDELPDGLAEGVARTAAAQGVTLSALSGTYNMAHPDPAVRARGRAGFAHVLRAAQRMGAPIVTLCTGTRHPSNMWAAHADNTHPSAWADLRAELDVVLAWAEEAGVSLGVEPEHANVVSDAEQARRLLDEVKSPRLGIVLDAANLLSPATLPRQREVMDHAFDRLGEALLLAHAKDMDAQGAVVGAGQGAVDLDHFVARLRDAGYTGALVGHGFELKDARASAATLQRLCAGAA